MSKRIILLCCSCILCAFALSAPLSAQEERRSLLFEIGAGLGFPGYPVEAEAVLSGLDDRPGVERFRVAVDVSVGFALSQNTFLMAGMDGTGDRLMDDSDYMQVNLYLYSLGLRYYPRTTGFYFEGNLGTTACLIQLSDLESRVSDFGFGYGAALGYDFNDSPRGFGLSLEARFNGLEIEGDAASALMLTLNCCWK